jgi:hypothetical protein
MTMNNRRGGGLLFVLVLAGAVRCQSELRCDPPLIKARDSNQCLFECGTR